MTNDNSQVTFTYEHQERELFSLLTDLMMQVEHQLTVIIHHRLMFQHMLTTIGC